MTPIQTFVLTPTKLTRYWLRTHARHSDLGRCWHDAHVLFGDLETRPEHGPASDGKFPTRCEMCDSEFGDNWEVEFEGRSLYKRSDNGELVTWRDAPAGAVLDCDWLHETPWAGDDGKAVQVMVPANQDGTGTRVWNLDGVASNCTRKEDSTHKCWCRHGPLECLTVDKNCNTCSAGAGSIFMNAPQGFHGMLQNGKLVRV